MKFDQIAEELGVLKVILQRAEDKRAQAYCEFDDEGELFLQIEVDATRTRIYELEQIQDAQS